MFDIFSIILLGVTGFFCYLAYLNDFLIGRVFFFAMAILSMWATISVALYSVPFQSSYIQANVIPTNTLFHNLNATNLVVYAINNGTIEGYLGPTSNSLIPVLAETQFQVLGVGVTSTNNTQSVTMIVPFDWYYQFNYTGSAKFTLEGIR